MRKPRKPNAPHGVVHTVTSGEGFRAQVTIGNVDANGFGISTVRYGPNRPTEEAARADFATVEAIQ